ncbi:nucleotidyltransferase domain-containing protein [Pseudoduganella aquatica]|uniref:Nucleotidyltransferase domain-containing protein n=1 Tax=Pseudoduganella aquatica TaxID=2660641 RepID=A0A7X4KL74_9BURK|nr:nucleotidyltransferase domain-containing protein [Pseudoduganella aquatica]MYN06475.1 nucleotidyltransferase domain-containing protein [Pseudoduganella aquatica]
MLADFLLGPFRARILSALLLRPEDSWHVRELARQLDALPGSVNRELIKLTEAGILVRQQIGNQIHYRANPACPILDEITSLLRKTSGLADQISSALQPLSPQIECAFIFGSVARGKEQAFSDIDILVLGDIGFNQIVATLHPLQTTLRREINPVTYRTEDFQQKLASGNTWASEVANNPKLFVIGNADDFGKLIEDRPPVTIGPKPR